MIKCQLCDIINTKACNTSEIKIRKENERKEMSDFQTFMGNQKFKNNHRNIESTETIMQYK